MFPVDPCSNEGWGASPFTHIHLPLAGSIIAVPSNLIYFTNYNSKVIGHENAEFYELMPLISNFFWLIIFYVRSCSPILYYYFLHFNHLQFHRGFFFKGGGWVYVGNFNFRVNLSYHRDSVALCSTPFQPYTS